MAVPANKEEILTYLAKMKHLLSKGNYVFVPRRKNLLSLARCGISIEDAKDEILDLTVDDYYKGPKDDFDPRFPGQIWEFKKNIGDRHFYIKVKISREGNRETLKCISFHEDDFS